MKIRTITLLTLLFLSTPIFSQVFKGGLLLGINGAQVDGDDQSGYDKFGIMGGAFIYTPISPYWDIQLEIEYMGKGAQSVSTADEGYQTEFTINLNYIELPVLMKLDLSSTNINTLKSFSFVGGLGFGYLFDPSQTLSSLYPTTQINFRSFELSAVLGFEYQLNDMFSVLGRFSYSITPIAHTFANPNDIILGSGLYNNLITVGLALKFPRG